MPLVEIYGCGETRLRGSESPLDPSFVWFLTGTFGQIFHGALLDEKDPSKEKQVFVKTVKGMSSFHLSTGCALASRLFTINTHVAICHLILTNTQELSKIKVS